MRTQETLSTGSLVAVLVLLGSGHASALEPLPDTCQFDPHVLTCFFSYETELRDFHYTQLDAIAEEVRKSWKGKTPINEIVLIGHAATWKSTDPVAQNATERSLAARGALVTRLEGAGVPMAEIDIIATGVGDTEPRFTNATPEGRAFNRRVEVTLTHVPGKEEPEVDPKDEPGAPDPLVFSKDTQTEPHTGLKVPADMPPPRFPKDYTGCTASQTRHIDRAWLRAHYSMWRADQVLDWLAGHSAQRAAAWRKGAPANPPTEAQLNSKSVYWTSFSPRNWFGPYEQVRFDNVDTAVEKVFENRFRGRTFKVVCKKGKPLASHAVFGRVVFYDAFFTTDDRMRGLTVVHEIYHGLALRNGTWVMDTHVFCGDGVPCTTSKHYDEEASLRLSWGSKPRHYRLAIRNNDSHAYFATNLADAIRGGTLAQFPPK
jgi:hypothetical protein